MKTELETLEAEVLDSIKPFSSETSLLPKTPEWGYSGNTMQRTQTQYTTAVSVQQPRSIAKIAHNMMEESRMAGKSFYYRWQVNSKDGKKTVEGPSIDMTMALLRYYGNIALELEVDETPTHYLFKATVIDLESGMSSPRLFRQRKNQSMGGKMENDRQEDIVFQIGQSKAIRNAIRNVMPGWLVEKCLETATEAELNKAGKENIVFARAKVIEFFAGFGVSVDRIEAERTRPADQWTPQDIVDLRGMATALKEGRVSPETLFPLIKSVAEEKPETKDQEPSMKNKKKKSESTPDKPPILCPATKLGVFPDECNKCEESKNPDGVCQGYQDYIFDQDQNK